MKIILSAHFDLAKPVKYIHLDDKNLNGLVDNFAGVFAAYTAARQTDVEVYLTNLEEVNLGGAIKVAKDLKAKNEKPLVIVVDTCTDAKNKKAYIGNAYNIDYPTLKKKFSKDVLFMDGLYEADMDETAIYGDSYKLPTFFFGIPIKGEYHAVNNKVSLKVIDAASEILVDVIKYLKKNSI